MLVGDYGSDSEGEGSSPPPTQPKSLPPTSKSTNGQAKSKKAPKKITIDVPAPAKHQLTEESEAEEQRPAKRSKADSKGAGSSALFSMLPAPKVKNPTPTAPPRVLGGGGSQGLAFKARGASSATAASTLQESLSPEPGPSTKPSPSPLFAPTSVAKKRANISLEEGGVRPQKPASKPASKPPPSAAPAVDFFSLDAASSSTSKSATPLLSKISSAPKIDDFVPPDPTPTDPYPGYYQLPSGSWAQYDSAYYEKFYKKWKADYDAQIRALEKGIEKGFEGADEEDTPEVNAQKEMERARREVTEREERKKLTMGGGDAPAAPNMNIQGAKMGKLARGRHQLTTLLADAYANREALEAKIAEGKRNRKEAGNKYGF